MMPLLALFSALFLHAPDFRKADGYTCALAIHAVSDAV
jgi:hypothetical protein